MRTRRQVVLIGLTIGAVLGVVTEFYFGPALNNHHAISGRGAEASSPQGGQTPAAPGR